MKQINYIIFLNKKVYLNISVSIINLSLLYFYYYSFFYIITMSKIIAGKYQIIRVLGKGAFGKVVLASFNGVQYAIKEILKARLNKEAYLIPYIEGQIDCMRSIQSEYVMNLIDVAQDETAKYMICEYCNGGNLFQYQCKLPGMVIPFEKTILIVSQIIKGIQHLHELQYLHRDLKPQNILVKKNGNDEIFKIADFGFARKEQATTGTILGTGKFMAPQIYKEQKYGYGVDMWALGVIIYFMLNNQYPFNPTRDQQIKVIQQKCTPYFSYEQNVKKTKRNLVANCTPETQQLFKRIFEFNPEKRLTFHEIKQSPLFKKYFETNTKAYESSSIIYKSKYIDKKQKPKMKTNDLHGIQQRQEESSIRRKSTKNLKKEVEQIQFYLLQIKFIKELSDLFQVENEYLFSEVKLALRYNLLKLYLIESKKFQAILKAKKVPEECPKLNWEQFFKSKEFLTLNNTLNDEILQTGIKFEESYNDCYAYKDEIKKLIPKFFQSFNFEISEKGFDDFKPSFRSSTTFANKCLVDLQKKYNSEGKTLPIQFTILRVKVLICHVLNKVFLKSELSENFVHYFEWKKTEKQLEEDPQKFYFDSFKKWLTKAQKNSLIKTVNIIWKRYFT